MADLVKTKLLVVSDSRPLQQAIATVAATWCETIVCEDPSAVPTTLMNHPTIGLAMVEQPLAKGGGVTVLEYLQKHRPLIRRILLATPNDLSAAVGALHRGSAQHIAYAPVSAADMEAMVGAAQKSGIRPAVTANVATPTPRAEPLYPQQAYANSLRR